MRRRAFLALPAIGALRLNAHPVSKDLYRRIHGAVEKIDVLDTHEHILAEPERLRQPVDFFTLASHYAIDDVTSAGLPSEERALLEKADVPQQRKWRAFEPYWQYARSTGYSEALRIAIRDIYGFDEISGRTIDRISTAIHERNRPGLYRDILKKRSRIAYAINDEYWQPMPTGVDREFFLLARKFEHLIAPITAEGLKRLERSTDSSITTLDGLKKALEKQVELAIKVGMVTIKSTIAYHRDLYFPLTSTAEASADFERLARGEGAASDEHDALESRPHHALSSHMFHHLVQLAEAHGVPMQIHTGMHAGNGNYVQHTHPSKLTNLFLRYPRVKFDVFHVGYPYHGEATVVAKLFPNVYVDYCWMHIISPAAARSILHEMLDAVPANKIFGFGGDYRYPELSYAHLVMARRNIAHVLAERVEHGSSTEADAVQIARWLMHDNPASVFLKKRA